LKITSPDGELTGIIVNYQAHPTQMPGYNADIHPEYPGLVAKLLFARYPALKFAAYFNGASGDVTIHGYKGGYHHAGQSGEDALANATKTVELLGQRFADLVIAAIDDVTTEPVTSVEVRRRFIFPRIGRVRSVWNRLPLYKTLGGKSRMLLHEFRDAIRIGIFYDLYHLLNQRYLPMLNIVKNGRHAHHQTELFVARINDIYWFSSPGEPFIMYQEALAKLVPSGKYVFSQMNETCGYIYPWSFYVHGGYEKFFSFDALFGEYLLSTFRQTLDKFVQS
jgi:hypothetical protein